jgi:hypothetical protein
MNRPPIVFVHVPKTGGTTFREMLRTTVGPVTVCDAFRVEDVAATIAANGVVELHNFLYRGRPRAAHVDVVRPEHRHILRGAAIFCLLRDPVEVLLSTYRHLLAHPQGWDVYLDRGKPVPESAAACARMPNFSDAQLRFLTDNLAPGHTVTAADVDRVCEWMVDLDVTVGVLEDLPEFYRAFERRVGIRCRIAPEVVLNPATATIADADAAEFRRIAAGTTRLDQLLYQRALKMVASRRPES